MTCQVCCESFNRSSHLLVKCPYCPIEVCSACSERYLCDTSQDAHCMGCRKRWSREILSNNFTLKFVSMTYKSRREELLYEREKSLMPATQPYVELEKTFRVNKRDIESIQRKIQAKNQESAVLYSKPVAVIAAENTIHTEWDAMNVRNKLANEIRKHVSALTIDIQHLEWMNNRIIGRMMGNVASNEKRAFVRACPYENCRGFLSTAWKCGLCDNWTCPDCHEGRGPNKDVPHTCDPGSVATAQLLAKDSRNCPKCASLIFKINGCDQMYCTQCHTAFSWRTGQVEMGIVHNPHYFEYQRMRGTLPRQPGDVPCGGYPDWREVLAIIQRTHPKWQMVAASFRSHPHCQHVLIPRYTVNEQENNKDLRIKFMIGDFGEDEFKRKIQQREKARHKKNDIRQVLEMYMTVIADLYQSFVQTKKIDDLINSLHELRSHVNATLAAVSKRYTNCAVPAITEYFELV